MADVTKTTDDSKTEETKDEKKTGMQHFDGTVSKVNADGMLVASSYVDYDNGEKLAADVTSEEITDAQAETSKVANDEQKAKDAEITDAQAETSKVANDEQKAKDAEITGQASPTKDASSTTSTSTSSGPAASSSTGSDTK